MADKQQQENMTHGELFVDNFAGGGGASTGIEIAIGHSVDIAINHDPDAIAMHRANHPQSKHYCEDVWQVNPDEACNGHPVALAWFSPDCKHFSRAKGGKPCDKSIRGLAWVAVKWALEVHPRVIMLENVPEIQTWGPIDNNGKPIKERSGETFRTFIDALTTGVNKSAPAFMEMCDSLSISPNGEAAKRLIKGLGYQVEFRVLKSCDYGAPTTRTRFYMIARRDNKRIVWPEASHAPRNTFEVACGMKPEYRPISDCIDWSKPCKSIFDRDKPLSDNTMKRIANGLYKYVINDDDPYIISEQNIAAPFIIQYHSETAEGEVRGQRVDEPIMTLDTSNRYGLIMSYLITLRNHETGQSVRDPIKTICTSAGHMAEIRAFLIKYYGNHYTSHSLNEPLDTITTRDRFGLVAVNGDEYGIGDIGMRFLTPRELFNGSGFPPDYIIDHDADGKPYPKSKQVARCGNAVTPPVPTALVRVNLPEYCEKEGIVT